jgi:16S rRNA A1518/A1519 N6-dimethyltransferase RsmA/KsgA/DIM1 with predicted DNA glycosylase/AP lyase activity
VTLNCTPIYLKALKKDNRITEETYNSIVEDDFSKRKKEIFNNLISDFKELTTNKLADQVRRQVWYHVAQKIKI